MNSDDLHCPVPRTVIQQGFLKRHGQGLLSTVSTVWLILYANRLEWCSDNNGKVDNTMPLDHTSTVIKRLPDKEYNVTVLQIQTGGSSGRMVVFEASNSATTTTWEAALQGVISKLKSDKKMKPSVVLLKKVLRRNSLLGLSFERSSSLSSASPSLVERFSGSSSTGDVSRLKRSESMNIHEKHHGELFDNDGDDGAEVALAEGFLQKRGHLRQSWTNRYFVLTSQRLTYFTDSTMLFAKGCVVLNHFSYVQRKNHDDKSTHRQLFSLHTSTSATATTISASDDASDRHMLLMNGLSEEDVTHWCEAIQKVVLRQKILHNALSSSHLSVCVSTHTSKQTESHQLFYDLQLVNADSQVVCKGHAYFADMKGLHYCTTDVLILHQTFPRSYKRNTFGVSLSEELLENRRWKLEVWLQEVVNCLVGIEALNVDEEADKEEIGKNKERNAEVDKVMSELGIHLNCSLQEIKLILSKEKTISTHAAALSSSSSSSSSPPSALSKLFGSSTDGEEADTDVVPATSTATTTTKEKIIDGPDSHNHPNSFISSFDHNGAIINAVKTPLNAAALVKLDLLQLLELCRINNIDASSFRTRKQYLGSLLELFKNKQPFLLGKNARSVVNDLARAYATGSNPKLYKSRSSFSATHAHNGSGENSNAPRSNLHQIFTDTLLKLDACPSILTKLQDIYTTKEKIQLIQNTIQIWDTELSFTSEDCALVKSLFHPSDSPHAATFILLKHRLSESAKDPEWVYLFSVKQGITGLILQLNRLMDRDPLGDTSAMHVAEIIKCARILVESSGRQQIIHTKTCIYTITLSLQFAFQHSVIAIECLEFLTESIVYGGAVALGQITNCFAYLATVRKEQPYEILLRLLAVENMAIHCSVLGLINSMVLYEQVTNNRIQMHSAINLLGFEKICGVLCTMNPDCSASNIPLVEELLRVHIGGSGGSVSTNASSTPTRDVPSPDGKDQIYKGNKHEHEHERVKEETDSVSGGDEDEDEEGGKLFQLRAGVPYDEALLKESVSPDDHRTPIHPEKGIMASYTQAIVGRTLTPSNHLHKQPTSSIASTGSLLAKQVRRMTINILEDITTPSKTSDQSSTTTSGGVEGTDVSFVEVTMWLHLQNNVLTMREIQKSRHNRFNKLDSTSRILMDQISDILDYGDFDSPVPFAIKGCITVVMMNNTKHFFHFGDDFKTKNAWLLALYAARDQHLFQKCVYSSQPNVELSSVSRGKLKKKLEKLISLYRSIRDEDSILVFNESVQPTAEGLSSLSSSISPSSSLHTCSSSPSPMDFIHYIHYEFQRRKDVKLHLVLRELAQYFAKNYPPKLPESEQTDPNEKIVHALAVPDSTNLVPKAPPLPPLPLEKQVRVSQSTHPVNMKQLFWQKIKPVNVRNTIWMSIQERNDVQWQELENKFGEKNVLRRRAIVKTDTSLSSNGGDTKVVNLFDAQRTQNVAIACAKLRKTPSEIYDIVLEMDPIDLTLDVTDIILHLLLPTNDEIACLRAYTGSIEALDYCGQLFSYFSQIEGLESRLQVQKIMLSWTEDATYALSLLDDVKRSLAELKHTHTLQPLKDILATVLTVGNYMNGNKRSGKAHGFKLTDLLKLKDIRENNCPQRHLLHFIVEQFPTVESSVFYHHWDVMWRAGKISQANVDNLIKQLQGDLDVCIAAISTAEEISDVAIRENLILRLGTFINKSSIMYDEVCELFETLDDSIILLKRYFGEILMANNLEVLVDDDPWSNFFSTLIIFATMHKKACLELELFEKKKRQQEARAKVVLAEKERKEQANALLLVTSPPTTPSTSGSTSSSALKLIEVPEEHVQDDEESEYSPRISSITKRPRSNSNSSLSPLPSSPSKQNRIDICALFKERMLALNGGAVGESDSDEESW